MDKQSGWREVFFKGNLLVLAIIATTASILRVFLGDFLERFMPWVVAELFFTIPAIGVGGLVYYTLVRRSRKSD
jgi:hypothetical protein